MFETLFHQTLTTVFKVDFWKFRNWKMYSVPNP